MNKKILAALCGVLVSGAAVADDVRFYVGADLGYSKHKYGETVDAANARLTGRNIDYKLKSKAPTFGVLAGVRYCENFGFELGYTFAKKAKYTGNNATSTETLDGSVKYSNFYADVLGYLPVADQFEAIGSIGFGRSSVKLSSGANAALAAAVTAAGYENDYKTNKLGFRLGLGGQYKFDDNFAVRAMVKYQKVGKKSDITLLKQNTSFNLGLTYTI